MAEPNDPIALKRNLQQALNQSSETVLDFLQREAGMDANSAAGRYGEGQSYRVGQFVAKGGMGAIFEVFDLNVQRSVAMKVMLRKDAVLDSRTMRFIHEAQVTGQLEHPNIVPVHELAVDAAGNPFYTMKYVRGITLEAVLQRIRNGDPQTLEQFPLSRLLIVFQKTCDAIAFAHSKNVVHRDLKPENIMIGGYGEVLVMDWGLAKVLRADDEPHSTPKLAGSHRPEDADAYFAALDAQLADILADSTPSTVWSNPLMSVGADAMRTMDGTMMGTPGYMAPEQAEGKVRELDARADIYALGGILYSILTTDMPIQAESLNELVMKKVKGEILPPTVYSFDSPQRAKLARQHVQLAVPRHCPEQRIPSSLAAVAMKALATRPADRYQEVQELQTDIEAYQAGFATAAEEASALRQLGLLIRRHLAETLIILVSILVLFIVMAGFLAWVVAERDRAMVQRNKAVAALDELRAEQQRRQELTKAVAPRFVSEARGMFENDRAAAALDTLDVGLGMDAEMGGAWALKGRIFLSQGQFADAVDCLDKGAGLLRGSDQDSARKYLALAREAAAQVQGGKLPLEAHLKLCQNLAALGDHRLALPQYRLYVAATVKTGDRRRAYDAAVKFLEYRNPGFASVSRLPVQIDGDHFRIDFSAARNLRDLSPLAGLPCTALNLADCHDLEGLQNLRGLPLQELNLNNSNVVDLAPLAGMKLRKLDLGRTAVDNLAPLKGLPLETLALRNSRIRDLSPLQELPLLSLDLSYSDGIRDLSPLARCPLQELRLDYTNVSDLAGLKGLPLRLLSLQSTRVRELSPLAGMKLRELDLYQTPVGNVAVLAGMPLERLFLAACPNLRDVSALAKCPELSTLTLPGGAQPLQPLKALPKLQLISCSQVPEPAAQFWAKYQGE